MTSTNIAVQQKFQKSTDRRIHRITIVAAGSLAIIGGTLALLVHPWFAAVAAVGGIWLILAPETKANRVQ